MAAPLGLAQSGERVRRFARLREHQQHGVFFQRRIAVTKFVGEFDLDRNLREFLNQVFTDERRVPARAARCDDDAVNAAQLGGSHVQAAEFRRCTFKI